MIMASEVNSCVWPWTGSIVQT